MAAHVHSELMIAAALNTDLQIESRDRLTGRWELTLKPAWHPMIQYRIKPAPPWINTVIEAMACDVVEVMESDLPLHDTTTDIIHEFAQLFARKLVQECADAAATGTTGPGVRNYIIERMGYPLKFL